MHIALVLVNGVQQRVQVVAVVGDPGGVSYAVEVCVAVLSHDYGNVVEVRRDPVQEAPETERHHLEKEQGKIGDELCL